MSQADAWTVGRLLQWTTEFLRPTGPTARGWTPKCCWPMPWAAGGSNFTQPSTRRPWAPAIGLSQSGPPPGRRHAGGVSGRPPRVLFAQFSRHSGGADPTAGNGASGNRDTGLGKSPPLPPGEGRGEGVVEQTGIALTLTISRRERGPHHLESPTSAPAAASSPSARRRICPPAV